MQTFTTRDLGQVVIIRLGKGELVLESIEEELKRLGVKNGILVSAIGSLRKACVHAITTTDDFPTNEYFTFENPIELGSAQGLILDGEPHFHLTVSEPDKTYTGHMEPGCEVQYLAEFAVLELPGLNLTRKQDQFGISYIAEK